MVFEEVTPSHDRHTQALNVDEDVDIAYYFSHLVFVCIFQLGDEKCLIYGIMFYIQRIEQFDIPFRLATSAEPQEDTEIIFYVFQCIII